MREADDAYYIIVRLGINRDFRMPAGMQDIDGFFYMRILVHRYQAISRRHNIFYVLLGEFQYALDQLFLLVG